ncbi:MAG TPA: TonB-dependent receptor [Bryobacteraceae bacterium]
MFVGARLGIAATGVLVFFLSAGALLAQQTASVSGTVTDPSGAAVPGAKVIITNTATDVSRTVLTSSRGVYSIPAVNSGVYNVTASAKGFKAFSEQGVRVDVGAKLSLDLHLQLGATSQTVTVEAAAAHLETANATVSDVITGKQLQSIAINGRNFDQLALLVPGASSVPNNGYNGVGHLSVSGIGFNGMHSQSNQFMIDGSNDLDPGSKGSLDVSPSLAAISQFRVATSNYSAAQGQAGGAVVSVRLKSGTNAFHGNAFEFLRNDALDARQAMPFQATKVPLKLNDFGFTLGGPIVHNKLFFFYSSEWRRLRQGTTLVDHTPTQLERSGDFSQSPLTKTTVLKNPANTPSCVTGDQISHSCFDPNALALLNSGAFPDANAPGFNNFVSAGSLPTNYDQELGRFDYDISSKLRLMVHYIRESYSVTEPTSLWGGSDFPTITNEFSVPSHNLAVRLTQIISPTLLNEVDFDNTNDSDIGSPIGAYKRPAGYTTPEIFPGNPLNRVPRLNFNLSYTGIDANIWPYQLSSPVFTVRDNVTQTLGSNMLTWGGMYQRGIKDQPNQCRTQGAFDFNGEFTGNPFADFLLGYPDNYSECSAQVVGKWRYDQYAAFVQDDWKVTKTLTLNLGVRYYLIPHAYAANGVTTWYPGLWNPDPKVVPTLDSKGNVDCPPTYSLYPQSSPCNIYNGVLFAGTPNALGIGKTMTKTYYFDFGPRFGLAWQLPKLHNTVLRTGYGVAYYRPQGNDTYNILGNPPIVQNVSYDNSPTAPVKLLDNPAAGTVPPVSPPGLFVQNEDYKIPMYQHYSFGLQHLFGNTATLSVMYLGTHGSHLRRQIDYNEPRAATVNGTAYDFDPALNANLPTNLYRPLPGLGAITMNATDANSDYNSLQVNFERQMSKNWRFQAVYTFARGFDNDNTGSNNRCNFNRRSCWAQEAVPNHLLVVNYIYNLPFFQNQRGFLGEILGGWRWSGITTIASGTPFTVGITGAGLGLNNYPNLTGPVTYPRTTSEWFNTQVFSTPADGYFGNEGLNSLYGPGYVNWDMSLSKEFSITERVHAQLEGDFFNIFNQVNLKNPNDTYGSSTFGEITTSNPPRIIQVGMDVNF